MGIVNRLKNFFFVTLRIIKYKWISNCEKVSGTASLYQPLLTNGKGKIFLGKNVQIGLTASPNYFSHYCYLEARNPESEIHIGDNVCINNAFSAVALFKIVIQKNVLIGINCSIIDNDGHKLEANKRHDSEPKSAAVLIEENVFIGDNVTILKGVTIGKNSVIGHSAVVTKNIPENVVSAGNPAIVIRDLQS